MKCSHTHRNYYYYDRSVPESFQLIENIIVCNLPFLRWCFVCLFHWKKPNECVLCVCGWAGAA